MDFENATKMLNHSIPVTRNKWNDQKVRVQKDMSNGRINKTIAFADGKYMPLPYAASQEDMTATDWEVAKG